MFPPPPSPVSRVTGVVSRAAASPTRLAVSPPRATPSAVSRTEPRRPPPCHAAAVADRAGRGRGRGKRGAEQPWRRAEQPWRRAEQPERRELPRGARAPSRAWRVITHKATNAQQRDFEQLKPGAVAGWLKRTFKLPHEQRLTVRRSQDCFEIELEPSSSTAGVLQSVQEHRPGIHLDGIPVLVRTCDRKGGGKTREDRMDASIPKKVPRGMPEPSSGVHQFWDRMRILVEAREECGVGPLKLHEHRTQWLDCWALAAAGCPGNCETLLTILLRAPAKLDIAPPAADVLQVLIRVVSSVRLEDARKSDPLRSLELVVDVIDRRLHGNESRVFDVDVLLSHTQVLTKRFMENASVIMSKGGSRGMKLMVRFTSIMAKYDEALRRLQSMPRVDPVDQSGERELPPWLAWQRPTIGWLMSDASDRSWLRAPGLSITYDSPSSYIETLQKLTCLLTFYWGAGAISPRCKHRQPASDQSCAEPLLSPVKGGRVCTQRLAGGDQCRQAAVFSCPRFSHPDAICARCLKRLQLQLMARPGEDSRCSTDVYDAIVEQEFPRRDGQVFVLSRLASRKPPKVEPNWRHSYRLNNSALCAIGRLSVAGEPLQPTHIIHWAEIVPVSTAANNDEGHNRSRGRMAVRLLGHHDFTALRANVDLDAGTRVFVIDLRVFAPEVVPVLAAYANTAQVEDFEKVPFVDHLIGCAPRRPPQHSANEAAELRDRITRMISQSEINLIQRLPDGVKSRLSDQICELAHRANLYGSQLEAFAEGLSCSVHCTLGPPGTGKSYTGVQMIAALDLVRDALISEGVSVGPIVLLSYKNHALDEMVKDVLKHPLLQSKMRARSALIRCGKPDDAQLLTFTEQRTNEESLWDASLNELVQQHQMARHFTSVLQDLAHHLEVHAIALKSHTEARATIEKWTPRVQKINATQVLTIAMRLLSQLARGRAVRPAQDRDGEPEDHRGSGIHDLVRSSKEACLMLQLVDCCNFIPPQEQNACVKGLTTEAEHWPNEQLLGSIAVFGEGPRPQQAPGRTCLILDAWLSGLDPPPRCHAAEQDAIEAAKDETLFLCREIVQRKGAFCTRFHGCNYPEGCDSRRKMVNVPFCDAHRCRANDDVKLQVTGPEACPKPRMVGGYCCVSHSCRACIFYHQTLGTPVCMALPHACENHQCWIVNCNKIIMGPTTNFCNLHSCPACVREGRDDVRSVLKNRLWCDQHVCAVQNCRLPNLEAAVQALCKAHACKACIGLKRLIDPLCPASQLCDEHRCQYSFGDQLCSQQRLEISDFCKRHSCRVCVDLMSTCIYPALNDFPRNVCRHHPLCTFMTAYGEQCTERADSAGLFCMHHGRKQPRSAELVEQTCHGITTRNKPCKSKGQAPASRKFYCNGHLSQAPTESSTEEDEEDEEELWSGEEGPEDFEEVKIPEHPPDWLAQHLTMDGFLTLPNPAHENSQPVVFPPFSTLAEQEGQKRMATQRSPPDAEAALGNEEDELARAIAISLLPVEEMSTPGTGDMHGGSNSISDSLEGSSSIADSRRATDSNAAKCPAYAAGSGIETSDQAADVIVDDDHDHDHDADVEPARYNMSPDEFENDGVEPARYDMNSDEMEQDEFEERLHFSGNEEQQRLQQILGDNLHDANVKEMEFEEELLAQLATEDVNEAGLDALNDITDSWSWTLPIETRWQQAARVLRATAMVLVKLRGLAQPHLDEVRRKRAEASADAFKNARLIAATVVGGVRRLDPLRAAEPFAAIVEEACEVMEPTLMAVLSMRSLAKLELVGDHRQLPAGIPNAWFNLEMAIPSIKISLFERLVDGASGRGVNSCGGAKAGVSPCTVLDEQRRMRPAISDFTRDHYTDLVCIQDHECTVVQRIGDRCLGSAKIHLEAERAAWATRGKLVPGVVAQEFFWDLPDNQQGRPTAGLSACNFKEAEAISSLVRYLTLCGVPRESISIITPYKGQKMALQKALQSAGVIRPPRRDERGKPSFDGSVIVSTVDRYQGDENDIVILSLVRTKPGNRFVALLNRFVVATSRARIGFFIVGTVDAVTKNGSGSGNGPRHWAELVDHLKQGRRLQHNHGSLVAAVCSSDGDVTDGSDSKGHTEGSAEECASSPQTAKSSQDLRPGTCGVGSTFPISCPRHPQTRLEITCGCMAKECKKVHFPKTAMSSFCTERCGKTLMWCAHKCGVPCHGPSVPHTKPEDCTEELLRPCHTHSNLPLICGTLFKKYSCNSKSLADVLENKYKCDVIVQYHRLDCSHSVDVSCSHRESLLQGTATLPPCDVVVDDWVHPACNHVTKAPRCSERRKWEESPPKCLKSVKHVKQCGCSGRLLCFERNESSLSLAPCMNEVTMPRPRCGHQLSLRCYERNALLDLCEASDGELQREGHVVVRYDETYGPAESELRHCIKDAKTSIPECMVSVKYIPECGHIIRDVPCAVAFRWADQKCNDKPPRCRERMSVPSILCGHPVNVGCSLASNDIWLSCPAINPDEELPEGRLDELPDFPQDMEIELHKLCHGVVKVLRHCGHQMLLPCRQLLRMVRKRCLPKCKTLVSRTIRECGHNVMIACSKKADPEPPCHEVVQDEFVFSCGKHKMRPGTCFKLKELRASPPPCKDLVQSALYRCNHLTMVPCHLEHRVTAAQPGKRLEPLANAVVLADEAYCEPCDDAPSCEVPILFRDTCGHDRRVPCELAFKWAAQGAPSCEARVTLPSPLCAHEIEVKCYQTNELSSLNLWEGSLAWQPTLSALDQSKLTVVDASSTRPQLENLSVAERELLTCGKMSMVQRPCLHEEMVPCIEALRTLDTGFCSRLVSITLECEHEATLPCHRASLIADGNESYWCDHKIFKQCCRCELNECAVDCSQLDVNCEQEVVAKLPCGHEVRWTCGEDVDPRADRTKACAECVLRQWQAVNLALPDGLLERLRAYATEKIPNTIQVEELLLTPPQVQGLVEAQRQLLSIGCDLLQTRIRNDELWELEKAAPPILSDMGCYDVVFCPLKDAAKEVERIHKSFTQANTIYGLSYHMLLLTLENLKECKPEGNEVLRICVGVAFRFSALEGTMPFRGVHSGETPLRVAPAGHSRKKKSTTDNLRTASGELIAKANRMRQQNLQQGSDYVIPTNKKLASQRFYWIAGAVLPLCTATIRLFHTCGVCCESFAYTDGESATGHDFLCHGCRRDCCICFEAYAVNAGLACDSATSHFICDECLDRHVRHASSFEALETFRRNEGIKCPFPECSAPRFEECVLAMRLNGRLTKAAFDDFTKGKERVQEQLIVAEYEAMLRKEEEAGAERKRRKNHIIDQILTVSCPRCGQAFVDFTGCMALKCSRTNCDCGFCAICQQDCGSDAHQHVPVCRYNTVRNGHFAREEQYKSMLNVYVSDKLRTYLDGLSPDQKQHALEDCQAELRHREFDPREFR